MIGWWQAGPALEANGAAIIPIAQLTVSVFGQGGFGTLSPAAVVVLVDTDSHYLSRNIDAPFRSTES